MRLSYAITACNELDELQKLIPFLIENKDAYDEIVVLFDNKNGTEQVIEYLLSYNLQPNFKVLRDSAFNNNFADWKNKLNNFCNGDYIFQLDADEMVTKFLIKNIKELLQHNKNTDLFYLPRVNTVYGITDDDIQKWGWKQNEHGWINYPDFQGRLYKKGMIWEGHVHEMINVASKNVSFFPTEYDFSLLHNKTIEKQRIQNNFYSNIS